MKIKQILDEALKEIQPDKNYEKEIFEKLDLIIKKINQNQKNIKAILGGSGAKGTWLKTFDADIFALFDYKKFKEWARGKGVRFVSSEVKTKTAHDKNPSSET